MSKLSDRITDTVMKDLRSRRGFRQLLDEIELDIQAEMRHDLNEKIQREIDKVVEGE